MRTYFFNTVRMHSFSTVLTHTYLPLQIDRHTNKKTCRQQTHRMKKHRCRGKKMLLTT